MTSRTTHTTTIRFRRSERVAHSGPPLGPPQTCYAATWQGSTLPSGPRGPGWPREAGPPSDLRKHPSGPRSRPKSGPKMVKSQVRGGGPSGPLTGVATVVGHATPVGQRAPEPPATSNPRRQP